MDNILEMDLSPEDSKLLKETLESWKEEVYAGLLEKVEEAKERKLEELEEASIEYREGLKKEYSDKMLKSLKEMERDIRAKVVAEVVADNPEIQILEQIKELVAPTLNEDYARNVYTEEIQTLRETVEQLQEEREIEEGAKKLAELVSPYSRKTQNLIISLVSEGNADEVTEQFYSIMESLEGDEEDEDEDDWDDVEDDDMEDEDDDMENEDEDEDDDMMSDMPKAEDFDDMEEFGQAMADWQEENMSSEDDEDDEDMDDEDDEDDEEDDEDDEMDDEDDEMEESYKGSSVKEGKKGKKKKVNESTNELRSRMLNLAD